MKATERKKKQDLSKEGGDANRAASKDKSSAHSSGASPFVCIQVENQTNFRRQNNTNHDEFVALQCGVWEALKVDSST